MNCFTHLRDTTKKGYKDGQRLLWQMKVKREETQRLKPLMTLIQAYLTVTIHENNHCKLMFH